MNVGDMSMILGFAPPLVVDAVARAVANGAHFLLPQDDAITVSELLAARTGMGHWQYTLSASQANVEAIRLARVATGRERIVIFDGKYHGHVEETMVARHGAGQHDEALGIAPGATRHTRVLPFNDIDAVERELATREVACVLLEPALTNCTLLLPQPGYLDAVRQLTRATGTLLVADEAHTFLLAYGGLTREWGLDPDVLTFGKGLGTGIPLGAYGVTRELAELLERRLDLGSAEARGIATVARPLRMVWRSPPRVQRSSTTSRRRVTRAARSSAVGWPMVSIGSLPDTSCHGARIACMDAPASAWSANGHARERMHSGRSIAGSSTRGARSWRIGASGTPSGPQDRASRSRTKRGTSIAISRCSAITCARWWSTNPKDS
jgi:glutamate-1-semialdehyde aminotransferase